MKRKHRAAPLAEVLQPVRGAVDRAHAGLISGWFACPSCPEQSTPDVAIHEFATVRHLPVVAVSRPDAPGGVGYVSRFPREGQGEAPQLITLSCHFHPDMSVQVAPSPASWEIRALGALEGLTWPWISGWFMSLDRIDASADVHIRIENDTFPAMHLAQRPDVEAFLGTPGVHGFQVNLASTLGFAPQNGSNVQLALGDSVLAEGAITMSPVVNTGADQEHRRPLRPLDTTRLMRGNLDVTLHSLQSLPARANSATPPTWALQWRAFFKSYGFNDYMITAWLLVEESNQLGVLSISQLPESLQSIANSSSFGRERAPQPSESSNLQHMYGLVFGLDDRTAILARMRDRLDCVYDIERYLQPATSPISPVPSQAATLIPAAPTALAQKQHVCVAGLGAHNSGLGLNASNSIRAFESAGVRTSSASFFPQPGGWNRSLGIEHGMTRDLSSASALLHLPLDRVAATLSAQPALATAGRVIGYYMWETSEVPAAYERSLQLVDEIWTASEFVRDALRRATDTPVHVTGHAVEVDSAADLKREDFSLRADEFVAHFSFDANSTVARKNPSAALDAFTRAFDGDPSAVFLLKIRNFQQVEHLAAGGCRHSLRLLHQIRTMPNLKVVTGEHSRARTLGMMSLADCYISLHRSEGFGYTIAEATLLGIPIITTGYSGNTEHFRSEDGWQVPFSLIPVLPGEYFEWQRGMEWAEADVDAAASALCEARSRGKTDRDADPHRHSITALGERYAALLHV